MNIKSEKSFLDKLPENPKDIAITIVVVILLVTINIYTWSVFGFEDIFIAALISSLTFLLSKHCPYHKKLLVFSVPNILLLFGFLNSTPIISVKDSMVINDYVENIEFVAGGCGCKKKVKIDFKKPFENGLVIKLSDEKYVEPITDSDKQDTDFKFVATKSCGTTALSDFKCSTKLEIFHKYSETAIGEAELDNSIYPKKLEKEI